MGSEMCIRDSSHTSDAVKGREVRGTEGLPISFACMKVTLVIGLANKNFPSAGAPWCKKEGQS